MIRFYTLCLTLAIAISAGANTHFNLRYLPTLVGVNAFNTSSCSSHFHETCFLESPSHTCAHHHEENANVWIPQFHISKNFGKDNILDHSAKADFKLRTVVIDPGHGGHDHGCSGIYSKEKHVALNIAKKLGNLINSIYPKVKVIYTRDKDVFIPLHQRAAIANRNDADLFISIHCNAISSRRHLVYGTETYVMGLHRAEENLDVAKRENASILLEEDYEKNYDGFDPNSPEGHIILSMFQNAFLEQSILFAEKVEENFKQSAGRKSRGVKQAGFLVLRETTMPSVLIETGYLTNKKEETFMASQLGQDELASAIFQAFRSYKRAIEVDNSSDPVPIPAKTPKLNYDEIFSKKKEKPKDNPPKNVVPKKEQPTSTSEKIFPKQNVTPSKEIKINHSPPPAKTSPPAKKPVAKKVFRVQLAASTRPLERNEAKWKNVNFPIQIKQEKGNFKYLAGNFENLDAAKKARATLQQLGFKDAFIVEYQGDKRTALFF